LEKQAEVEGNISTRIEDKWLKMKEPAKTPIVI
jgi:hypothetical protein